MVRFVDICDLETNRALFLNECEVFKNNFYVPAGCKKIEISKKPFFSHYLEM